MDLYEFLQYSHLAVALALLRLPGSLSTGLWLFLSAFFYMWTIEPDVVAQFPEGKEHYTYVTYLAIDMLFALAHWRFGGKGSKVQAIILFSIGLAHGYAWLEYTKWLPGIGFTGYVYTPLCLAANILQIAFAIQGVVYGLRFIRQRDSSSVPNDGVSDWANQMLAETSS